MDKKNKYIDTINESLDLSKEILSLLEARIELIKEEISTKSGYEQNEYKIVIYKTNQEIEVLKKIIREKEAYLKKYVENFEKDWKEVESNFVLLLARARNSNKEQVKALLSKTNFDVVDSDCEAKVFLYKKLKSVV
jgi:hypothetical protein